MQKYDVIFILRWRPRRLNTTSAFLFVDVAGFRTSKSISKPKLSTYLNSRLRYNYFRFSKTKIRHIGVLRFFDLDHIAVICMIFCINLQNFITTFVLEKQTSAIC